MEFKRIVNNLMCSFNHGTGGSGGAVVQRGPKAGKIRLFNKKQGGVSRAEGYNASTSHRNQSWVFPL